MGHVPAWVHILDRYVALDGDAVICPGVNIITLPGHTSGSQGVLVDTLVDTTIAGQHLLPGPDRLGGSLALGRCRLAA